MQRHTAHPVQTKPRSMTRSDLLVPVPDAQERHAVSLALPCPGSARVYFEHPR